MDITNFHEIQDATFGSGEPDRTRGHFYLIGLIHLQGIRWNSHENNPSSEYTLIMLVSTFFCARIFENLASIE
jgi:hypothetical protein